MDAIIIVVAYMAAWAIRFVSPFNNDEVGRIDLKTYLMALIFVVPAYLILYAVFSLYTPKRMHGQRYEMFNVIKANTIGLLMFILVLYLTRQIHFSRIMLVIFYGLNITFEFMARVGLRMLLRNIRKRGFNQKHIVLVGYSRAAEGYIDRIKQFPQWGYNVVGILDDHVDIDTKYRGEKVVGRVSEIEQIISENDLDEIVITLGLADYAKLEKVVTTCEKLGVHTKFIPDYNNIIPTKPYIEDVQGIPVINIRRVPLSSMFNKFLKRFMDIIIGSLALLIFSPIMLIVAILVKTTSKGPVIYKQERVGLHNKNFNMYKFRSMKETTDGSDKSKWTTSDDPRVTKVGKFLRKTSIDELPQLINVLKGDMSLVGPRPERPFYVDKFKEEIPRYMIKHQVRPGITGWAQVNGYRGDTSINKRIECDLYYIENWTLFFDFKILVYTVFKGFVNKNAY
jgi:Undecaprenyl-phosphate glucose phosphotransferase